MESKLDDLAQCWAARALATGNKHIRAILDHKPAHGHLWWHDTSTPFPDLDTPISYPTRDPMGTGMTPILFPLRHHTHRGPGWQVQIPRILSHTHRQPLGRRVEDMLHRRNR